MLFFANRRGQILPVIDELKHKAPTHDVQTRLKIGYQSKLAMLMTMLLLISMFMLISG